MTSREHDLKRHSLRRTRFFAEVPEAILDRFGEIAVLQHVRAGDSICRKGDPGNSMYVITQGVARVHDRDLVLNTLTSDQMFGELSTFEDSERSASVTAETDMVVLRIDRDPLFGILGEAPGAGLAIARGLCRCLRERTENVIDVTHHRKALERELDIGRQIQAGFLPDRLPDIEGWDIKAHFRAAREVAGDFYDAFLTGEGDVVGVVIGDVCDKGVGAALFMTLFRSLLRATAKYEDFVSTQGGSAISRAAGPAALLQNSVGFVNNYIAKTHGGTGMFATLFFALLEPRSGRLLYVNAGHESPVICTSRGIKATLDPTGPAVGLFAGAEFDVGETRLDHGDAVLAYTDGVTDAANSSGETFGFDRLAGVLISEGGWSSSLVAKLASAVDAHAGGMSQFDDITMLGLARTGRRESQS